MYRPDKPEVKRRVDWRRMGALFAPYWGQQLTVLACIVVASVLGLVPGFVTARLIDVAIPRRDLRELSIDVGLILASALTAAAVGVLQGYLNSLVGEGIMRDIRTQLVAHLHRMPLTFFTGTKTGEIMNRVSNDVDNIDNVVTGTLTSIVTNVVVIASTLIAMFVWNWRLALLSIVIVPLMILPLGPVGRRMYDIRKKTREKRDEIESITQETLSISGITLIKSFAREAYERSRFYDVGTRLMRLEIDLAMVGRWFLASVTAMIVIGPALVWFGGGWYAIAGGLQVGVIVAFVSFIQGRLYGPAAALAGIQVQIVSALAVFERIFDYLDMQAEEYVPAGAVALPGVRGDIAFDNVAFSYDESRRILDGVSFRVAAGQAVAFVGPSGGGKTTITSLVPRFYDPQEGRVSVDGHDVRTLELESLRRNIGIVTQETYLFHDTIANNLRYGNPDATDADLEAAARAASIHDFIATLPEGYATVVGERGHKLSGGERQRLAIARVLLKDPRILILDEATSSLDSENEAAIQGALLTAMRGRTSLVIAHRLSTILAADTIF
ncbi:MAG TPA: ABC transporter ATP-binding protein, partial [Candidatus Tumulicola sp.]|nr:ABC transporter ATP-binding protein [Candidatus Tumulicola sp.]